jgi:hypothetical protein
MNSFDIVASWTLMDVSGMERLEELQMAQSDIAISRASGERWRGAEMECWRAKGTY